MKRSILLCSLLSFCLSSGSQAYESMYMEFKPSFKREKVNLDSMISFENDEGKFALAVSLPLPEFDIELVTDYIFDQKIDTSKMYSKNFVNGEPVCLKMSGEIIRRDNRNLFKLDLYFDSLGNLIYECSEKIGASKWR